MPLIQNMQLWYVIVLDLRKVSGGFRDFKHSLLDRVSRQSNQMKFTLTSV